MNQSSKRIMIFIDGSNLLHGAMEFRKNFKIDMMRLRNFLSDGRDLIRAYYYGSFEPRNEQQEAFHRFMGLHGYDVKVKALKKREETKIEKGADVMLVTDMLSFAMKDAYDTAIVVSGDADFVGAIEEVKRTGKRVEVASFSNRISFDMRQSADIYVNLDECHEKIAYVKNN